MKYLVVFLIIFIIIYLFFFLCSYLISKKRNTLGTNKAFRFIVHKYDLKMNEEHTKKLSLLLVLGNSVILSSTLTVMWFLNTSIIVKMIISFIIFIIEFLIIYNLIGYILKKKGW